MWMFFFDQINESESESVNMIYIAERISKRTTYVFAIRFSGQ